MDYQATLGEMLPCPYSTKVQQQAEERQQLQQAMSRLEEKSRMAVELVFVSELSRKDVAKKIGTSPMTVSRYLQKGIQELITYFATQTFPIKGAGENYLDLRSAIAPLVMAAIALSVALGR